MAAVVNESPFSQGDVFAPGPKPGNPVAVVHGADDLSTEQMQSFAGPAMKGSRSRNAGPAW